ncbi:hypothetical protein SETIT_1G122700v2 [Setaria italica]|uniref:Leucine-rich repeat-containing N-terminal plant-type domain-containing protein n=1 Tax=Setaria italica TaxID=4555 RepID=A0A368PJJ7_SETIT|nr:hypothetical protein SETIT_1G122700v2 [Setaria italica]
MHAAILFVALTALGGGGCVPSERAALLDVRRGFTGDPDGALSSWTGLDTDCCRWRGVVCDNATGRVAELRLCNALADAGSTGLSGKISPARLSHNSFSRGGVASPSPPLPRFIGALSTLRYLNLSNTYVTGEVPPQLGNLSALVTLDLSYLAGLYSADLSWLAGLTSLEYLDMGSVNLNASVGWARDVNTLPSLGVLSLPLCELTMTPPANLTRLQRLDLSSNAINASTAEDAWLWHVPTLTYLDLSGNSLSSPFPDAIGNMTGLQVLDLNGNAMAGMIPATLQHLCLLQVLDMTVNQISGDMSDFMARLPRCALGHLRVLQLSAANVSGRLPEWIVSLEWIDLSHNSMSMEIRPTWKPPCKLVYAYFPDVRMGPQFPAWIRHQPEIRYLDISHSGIVDTLPRWFWKSFADAVYLNISVNQISGRLPSSLRFMNSSLAIYLGANNLTGSVPLLPEKLLVLDLSRNSLSGPIPSEFGAPELVELDVSSNRINGTVPESLCQFPNLMHLDNGGGRATSTTQRRRRQLRGVRLRGGDAAPQHAVPGAPARDGRERLSAQRRRRPLRAVAVRGLRRPAPLLLPPMLGWICLTLPGKDGFIHEPRTRNQVLMTSPRGRCGEFPVFLKHCKDMTFLDLAQNMFSGILPEWIGSKLPSLTHLRLRSNMFTGNIPTQLAELGDLQLLDLADNRISGYIPSYGASGNDRIVDSLPIVTKGQDRGVIYMVSLDLSDNVLDGEIPEELSALTGLVNLNLSRNHLTGTVPWYIGAIKKLESLGLLDSLSHLNMSWNNLSGRIPQGNQLQSLANPAYIYTGNAGLCGPPLLKNCSSGDDDGVQAPLHGEKGLPKIVFFYLGLAVGFVVGLWLVFCSLLFVKTWRFAYFRAIDKTYDIVYVFVVVRLSSRGAKESTTS